MELVPFVRRYGPDALVLVLALAAEAEVFLTSIDGPKAVIALAALLFTLPLLLRRRFPVAFAFVIAAVIAGESFFAPEAVPASGAPLVAMLATAFVVAADNEMRKAVAGLGVLCAAVVVVATNDPAGGVTDAVFVSFTVSLPWLTGVVVRARARRASELEEQAGRLKVERDEMARAAVAEERGRIARELHDVIAHSVSVMVVQAQAAQRVLVGEQPSAREALSSIETTGREALVEMRRLLGMLRRSDEEIALAPQPSVRRLEPLLEQVRQAGLPVELHVEGDPEPLPPGVELSAYRIVQEALTNALKHAGPARARVVVRYGASALELEIADDGTGRTGGNGAGHGLVGMRERVALYGGELEAGRRADRGYAVRARFPLDAGRA